jgi:excinuclease ABC subunit A
MDRLVDKGNTVVVIEHNMDIIKVADHIIDIGLEGGDKGGEIIYSGSPEQMVKKSKGHTARYLAKEVL